MRAMMLLEFTQILVLPQSLLKLWNAGCGLVMFFLLEKDSLNFQKQESNEFPCGKKGPVGHE